MKPIAALSKYLIAILLAFVPFSVAQTPVPGVPAFGSFGGGPFDNVNLGNLNVNFAVPIINKAGRGIPFTYVLGYNSSIWQIVGSGGSQSWTPVSNTGNVASYWGWNGLGPVFTPYVSYSATYTTNTCYNGNIVNYYTWQYNNFVYHDQIGSAHSFNVNSEYIISPGGSNCPPNGPEPPYAQSATANDSSGYTITIPVASSGGSTSGPITSKSGTVIIVPFLTSPPNTSSPYTATDANGNSTSFNNGVYTDTLGTTVLTATGSAPSPVTFTYTGPAGSPQYKVNYTSYNIKTNFLCNPIQEYTASNVPLVSSISLPDGSQYSFAYEDTPNQTGYKTARISMVTLPTGGTISYNYNYLGANDGINCSDGSTVALQRTLSPGGTWQYSRTGSNPATTTTVIDPASNYTVVNFEEGPASNFYETQRLAYQGSTSGTLLSTTINCYNGQSVGTPTNCYNTPITAQVTEVTNFRYLPNAAGVQSETDSKYDTFGLIHEVDEYDYGVGSVGSLLRKTLTSYAVLGNGIVDRPSNVTIEDSGNNHIASTSYGYDESSLATPTGTTPQWTLVSGYRGNLTTVTAQTNGSTNLYRKYTYYNTGMLSSSTDVSTSNTTNGATTTYNYSNTNNADCGNSFVTSISEPVGSMSRSFTWDCNGGVLLSVTDENGKASSTAYNGTGNVFWRPSSTTDEAGTTTNYSYNLTTSTPPVEFQTESKYATAFNGGSSTVDKVTTNDGFGRTVFSQTRQGPSASNYDTIATCYDSSGRVSLTTLPYSAALASSTSTCPSTNAGTAYSYDALGRTSSANQNCSGCGTVSYTYNENDTTETRSSPTVAKQSEFDGLGRLRSVCEITGGTTSWPSAACSPPQNTSATGYLTKYAYDLLGNITGVTQNSQTSSNNQSRTYAYDMLGRLTSETNPEMNNSAITYSYDSLSSDAACGSITSAGNLLKRLDAAGNATCYSSYDAFHRVGNVTYPSSSTPSKYFVYDAATLNGTNMSNAKTRLAEAYTCIGGCSSKVTDLFFSYWPTGQTTDAWELTPHSGTNYYYHVTSTPWPNGAVNTLSNLVGLPTITYGADGEGRMSTVSASTGQNPVTSVTYNPASQATALTYGSADSDSFIFDPNTGRMSQYQFSMGSTPKTDKGVIGWNTNGSMQTLTITDQINSTNTQTCSYTHDNLGRIASANCGSSKFNQNFSYDPFGNINKTVPTGSTGTSFQVNYDPNLTNRVTTAPYSYTSSSDPNAKTGNMTADAVHGYSWDTQNRLSIVDPGLSNGVCITYDALDRVVEQATGSSCSTSFTEIVYSPAGSKLALMNGSTLTKAFVALPGGAQAVYNGSGLQFYRHPDWLGSSRLGTTPSRTKYSDVAYAPFGENYLGSGTQDLSFTGQNQDTEQSASGGAGGLYDFMFRKHSPVQGRWLSPDPAGLAATPSDPQSWNRYAYLGNRPTNKTDALGLLEGEPCDPFWDPFCGGCDPVFGCDPGCDPVFGCGPVGPNPPPFPPIGPPPQREGGVWPNNETLGLPQGLNQDALTSVSGILSLLPGLNCGNDGSTFLPSSSGPCMGTIEQDATLAVALAAIEWKFGRKKIVGNCKRTHLEPTYAHCAFLCEYDDKDGNILVGGAEIGMGDLTAKCGPITHCPSIVGVDKTVFCIFGKCVGAGSLDIRYCIP